MTVLLIDAGGNRREWEIQELVQTLLVPLPAVISPHATVEPIEPMSRAVVRFDRSDEPSYPTVYRFVKVAMS